MKRTMSLSAVLVTLLWANLVQAEIMYKVIDLGTVGGYNSEARFINNAGQIVGAAEDSKAHYHATLFDPTGAGNNIDLGTLGGDESNAFSINEAGQIIGGSTRATLFDPTGARNNIDMGTLGGELSRAHSINNAGQIVGWASYRAPSLQNHATLFDTTGAGTNIDLGTLGGYLSGAGSINDVGQIVGAAQNNEGDWRATLFDPTGAGNNIDLNTLIDPTSGWTLVEAFDINNSGWIVGYGTNPQGETRAFLLVPEPATFALLGLGILCLRKRSRRN